MPGSITGPNGTQFGTISGTNCGWNAANNNDVWVRFNATTNGIICIGISGLVQQLQSIIVTDANADGDNSECTQAARTNTNDPNWIVVSCPRDAIYTTTSGTNSNQQHCFQATAGKTYYLVVDGNGGAESPFYISGIGDYFICSTSSSQTINTCGSYTWNGTTYTQSGTYIFNTKNKAGCDSTATLNLTITPASTSSTPVTACDSYTWNGTTYTQSGTYKIGRAHV